MKKTLLILAAAVLCTTYSQAQFSQGMWCLSAEVGIHNYKDTEDFGIPNNLTEQEDINNNSYFSVGGAYFINNNVNVGLRVGSQGQKLENTVTNTDPSGTSTTVMKTETSLLNFCATGEYLTNTGSKVGGALGAKGMFTTGSHEDENSNSGPFGSNTSLDEYKVSGFGVHLVPGIYMQLTQCLFIYAFIGGLNYHSMTYELDAASVNGMSQDISNVTDEETESALWFDINPRNYTFRLAYYFGGTGADAAVR